MEDAKQRFAQGDFQGALGALAAVPDSAEKLALKARVLAALQRFDEAFEAAGGSLHLDNSNLVAHNTIAGIYILKNEPAAALPHLDFGLGQSPDDIKMLNNRAKAHIMMGQPEKAGPDIQRLERLVQSGSPAAGQFLQMLKSQMPPTGRTSSIAQDPQEALNAKVEPLIAGLQNGAISRKELIDMCQRQALELFALSREDFAGTSAQPIMERAAVTVQILSEGLSKKKTLGLFPKKKCSDSEVQEYLALLSGLRTAVKEAQFLQKLAPHIVR